MRIACALVLVFSLGGCGPIAFVPGVRIGGTEVPAPSSWAEVDVPDEVLLRAQGGFLPRVVTIWAVESEGSVYVSGTMDAGWVQRLESSPKAHLRIGDLTYPVRAELVEDPVERVAARKAFIAKYREEILEFTDGREPDPEETDSERRIFRLEGAAPAA